LELRTGSLDKIEYGLIKTKGALERTTGNDNSSAAMALALVVKGKLDFRANIEGPLGEKAHTLG
jgi:hypothetical protein